MMKKKKIVLVFLALFLSAAFFILIISYLATQLVKAALSELRWQGSPSIVGVFEPIFSKQPGLLLTRLKDGKPQFLDGDKWEVNFSPADKVFVFGFPKAQESGTPLQKLFIIQEDATRIQPLGLSKMPGILVSVKENPEQTYLSLEIKGTTKSGKIANAYCIIEPKGVEDPSCQQLNVNNRSFQGLWNPLKGHELALKADTGEILIYDPWEKKPLPIDSSKEPERYKELAALFAPQKDSKTEKLWKIPFGIFVRVKQEWSLFYAPLFSKAAFIEDLDHIIVKSKNSLQIMEISTGKIATLLSGDNVSKKKIIFRTVSGEQTL